MSWGLGSSGVHSGSLYLNGESIGQYPAQLAISHDLEQTIVPTGSGGRLFRPYSGPGYPDVRDRYDFSFPYVLLSGNTDNNALLETLEELRKKPGPHTLTIGKWERVTYSLPAGASSFYLPATSSRIRLNAPSVLSIEVAANLPAVTVGGAAKTVLMKPSVVSGDAVPSGECWISRTIQYCKFAPALVASATVVLTYIPMFRVIVTDVRTQIGAPAKEGKNITLAEL